MYRLLAQLLCFEGGYSLSLQLPESDANYDDKLDILDVCGMQEPVVFEFLPNADPPEDLLLFLRLLNLSGPDAFHLEAIFRNEIQDHLAFPVSEDNESNICDTMISGCKEALQAYQRIDYKKSPTAKQELMKKVDQEINQKHLTGLIGVLRRAADAGVDSTLVSEKKRELKGTGILCRETTEAAWTPR